MYNYIIYINDFFFAYGIILKCKELAVAVADKYNIIQIRCIIIIIIIVLK